MVVPFVIGKNSSGQNHSIDLSAIPLLMISYSDDAQLSAIFTQAYGSDYPYKKGNYLLTNSRRLHLWEIDTQLGHVMVRDEPELSNVTTRNKLLQLLREEIAMRYKILARKKITSFQKYLDLNTWNEVKLAHQFFLVDDIWDIVTAKPKSLGLSLMQILLQGPSVGIHTIFASGISYRNLLQQLTAINPAISKALQLKFGIPEPKVMSVLGHELIYTADDFVFYKPQGQRETQRFFKG